MEKDRFAIYIGDDATDEDAYIALKNKGLSISIGEGTNADYYIKNQGEAKKFLMILLEELNK